MTDAYCPICRTTKLEYCMGDQHHCPDCKRFFMTDQVIDKDGFFLVEKCPLDHYVGYRSKDGKKLCLRCGSELVKVELLRYRYNDPKTGIARLFQSEGDRACEYRFRCEHYNELCAQCPKAWENKYKAMSASKVRKTVEPTRKRLGSHANVRGLNN